MGDYIYPDYPPSRQTTATERVERNMAAAPVPIGTSTSTLSPFEAVASFVSATVYIIGSSSPALDDDSRLETLHKLEQQRAEPSPESPLDCLLSSATPDRTDPYSANNPLRHDSAATPEQPHCKRSATSSREERTIPPNTGLSDISLSEPPDTADAAEDTSAGEGGRLRAAGAANTPSGSGTSDAEENDRPARLPQAAAWTASNRWYDTRKKPTDSPSPLILLRPCPPDQVRGAPRRSNVPYHSDRLPLCPPLPCTPRADPCGARADLRSADDLPLPVGLSHVGRGQEQLCVR